MRKIFDAIGDFLRFGVDLYDVALFIYFVWTVMIVVYASIRVFSPIIGIMIE